MTDDVPTEVVHTESSEVAFRRFVAEVEPPLRRALVAAYGSERGREATAEALAWSWEHFDTLDSLANPVAYLFRVGQSRSRLRRRRVVFECQASSDIWVEPKLSTALASLTERQRVSVMLVHGAGWTHAEVAQLLGVSEPTVQTHVDRALRKLRAELGGTDDRR